MDENTELLLLGLLGRQGMHGYELSQFLEHRLSFLSDLKKPTAYRLLDRLHGSGLVARTAEKAGRRPERGVYSLTAAGEARLDGLLRRHLARSEPTRGEILNHAVAPRPMTRSTSGIHCSHDSVWPMSDSSPMRPSMPITITARMRSRG